MGGINVLQVAQFYSTFSLLWIYVNGIDLALTKTIPGCCFNNSIFDVGSVILENQESCLNLVCATEQTAFSPVYTIVKVQIPLDGCDGTPCKDCYDTSCVDSGTLFPLGSTWLPNECTTCECTPGQLVLCKELKVECPPAPHDSCGSIPGPCCPVWECPFDHCIDEEDNRRELGDKWGTPCKSFECTARGITTSVQNCTPLPPLNATCELITPPDQCCPMVSCGCVDDGVHRELNESWGNPCQRHTCTPGGVATYIVDCAMLPSINSSCQYFTPDDECCPQVVCGCVDDGVHRELNESWGNPCQRHTCTPGGVATNIVDCPMPPFINSSCQFFTPEDECCPQVTCGCVDDGVHRELNESWGNPCQLHTCTPGGVATKIVDCPMPPFINSSCQFFTPDDECCPQVTCGCVDDGVHRELNESWGNPCQRHTCTPGGVATYIVDCPMPPYINSSCKFFTPDNECCPQVSCGCVDDGVHRELNESWGNPCQRHTCTPGGVATYIVDCAMLPSINSSCQYFTPDNECCPQVVCGCVDDGVHRELNESWGNPCQRHTCTPGGVATYIVDCAMLPSINSSCQYFTPDDECCTQVVCGCVDHAVHRELNESWGNPCQRHTCTPGGVATKIVDCPMPPFINSSCQFFTPEDECCPQVTCGCVDDGVHRKLNESWGNSCQLQTCTPGGVATKIVDCPMPPFINSSCQFFTPDDECCPQVTCGCVDDGVHRELNESWGNPCQRHTCTPGGVAIYIVDCPMTPFINSSCQFFTPEEECCPQVTCGCVNDGVHRELNESWGNPCQRHTCTPGGVATYIVDCPMPPYINSSCQFFTPDNECCPQVSCGCVDDGVHRELNESWGNPCQLHTCTPGGVATKIVDCPMPPFINSSCQFFTPDDECCPQVTCGCEHNGQVRQYNETWGSPCEEHTCTPEGVFTLIVDCLPPPPSLNDSCELFIPEGKCCPILRCGNVCKDDNEIYRTIGETWVEGCQLLNCTLAGIHASNVTCPELNIDNSTCEFYKREGECCPQVLCGGCKDGEGNLRKLFEKWGEPCNTSICTANGAVQILVNCPPVTGFNDSCHSYVPEGECCPRLKCGLCHHYGKYYEFGEEFKDPYNPCVIKTCQDDGIHERIEICGLKPNPWCQGVVPEGECCTVWNCSGCPDGSGGFIAIGTKWIEYDPCTEYICTSTGVSTVEVQCLEQPQPNLLCEWFTPPGECCPQWVCPDIDPCEVSFTITNGTTYTNACIPLDKAPQPNCELIIVGGCCPKWKCGPDCRLVRCGLPPKPAYHCVLYTPRLGCCQLWNCGDGCTDSFGNYYQQNETYIVDPCTKLKCENGVLTTIVENCPVVVRPHRNCKTVTLPGRCCKEWKCGEDCSLIDCRPEPEDRICTPYYKELACCPTWNCRQCIDDDKSLHTLGETWYSEKEPCKKNYCANYGIITKSILCTEFGIKLDPNCELVYDEGICCPRIRCGCIDDNGDIKAPGDKWVKDCHLHECIGSNLTESSYVPCILDEPEHGNCLTYTPYDKCCPEWLCGQNCAVVLCLAPPDGCQTNPLPSLACCPDFTCLKDPISPCEVGDKWEENCFTYECHSDHVLCYQTPCNQNITEHKDCVLTKPLSKDDCCPIWTCGTEIMVLPVTP